MNSDSTNLSIQSVSGYKNLKVTDSNGFIVDGGVVPITGEGGSGGSNPDQGTEDTSFDVPTEGTGYYLVPQVNNVFRYSNATKFSEYDGSNRAVIKNVRLTSDTLFQVRKYDFEKVGDETKTVSAPLVFTSNDKLVGATLSEGSVCLTSTGTFNVWLDKSNFTLGFENIDANPAELMGKKGPIKQIPRRATSTTVYYAINTNYTVKLNVNFKGDGEDWHAYEMEKTQKWFQGKRLYSKNFTDAHNGLGKLQFQLYNDSVWASEVEAISEWTTPGTYNGKLYTGSKWVEYVEESATFLRSTRIFFKPNTNWLSNSARLAAYFFNNGSDAWAPLQPVPGQNSYYYVDVPSSNDWYNLIFVRLDPSKVSSGPNWGAKWNQTADLFRSGGFLYEMPEGEWDGSDSTHWQNAFRIVYDSNGGDGGSMADVYSWDGTSKVASSNGFTKNHYTFLGWNTQSDGNGTSFAVGDTITLADTTNGCLTLYAQWTPNTMTVTYNANGGTGTMDTSSHTYGTAGWSTLSANGFTAPAGKVFTSWNTKDDGTGTDYSALSADDFPNSSNTLTLYAKWETCYVITLDANDGTGGSVIYEQKTDPKQTVLPSSGPVLNTYEFDSWNTASDGSGTAYAKGYTDIFGKDITLYAIYKKDVALNNDGATSKWNVTYKATPSSITPPTKTGYDFGGYWTGENGTGTKLINAEGAPVGVWTSDANVLYAKWTIHDYSITYYDKNEETFSGTHASGYPTTHHYGANTNLLGASKTGYTFDGWFTTSNCSGDSITSIPSSAASDQILYAKWTLNSWAVTISAGDGVSEVKVSANNNGTNLQNSGTSFNYNVPVCAYAVLKPGWQKQDSWVLISGSTYLIGSYGGTNDAAYSFGSISAKAVSYSIVYDMDGGTEIASGSYTISASSQEKALATSSTKTGYNLSGYSIVTNSSGTKSSIISGPKLSIPGDAYGNITVRATWTLKTTNITFNPHNGIGGSDDTVATYSQAMPEITPPTLEGYDFQGYFAAADGNGKKYYNANGTSANTWDLENTSYTLHAYWVIHDYTVTLNNAGLADDSSVSSVHFNAAMPSIVAPTYSGKTFLGYYAEANGGGQVYYNYDGSSAHLFDNDSIDTLYAYWEDSSTTSYFLAGETLYLYCADSTYWENDSARFAAFFYNDSTSTGAWFNLSSQGSHLYSLTIPYGEWSKLTYCRMNPSYTDNQWNSDQTNNRVWNQTIDYVRSSDTSGHRFFRVSDSLSQDSKNTGTWFDAVVSGQRLLLSFNNETIRDNWDSANAITILKLFNGSNTTYIAGSQLKDRNQNTDSYLFEIPNTPTGQWWINVQYLRVNPSYYSGHEDDPSYWDQPSPATWNSSTPSQLPALPNNCWKISSIDYSAGNWVTKVLKPDGYYLVGNTTSTSDSHPLIDGGGDNWNLDGAQLIADHDTENYAIWSGILLPGDEFKVVYVSNYTPTWYGYRSTPDGTSSASVFFSSTNYSEGNNIVLASSTTIGQYHVNIYYNAAGVYVYFNSFDTKVQGNVKYSTILDAKEGNTADTSGDIPINVPLANTTIGNIEPIGSATLDTITYFDWHNYSLSDTAAKYSEIESAVDATITTASPTIYATYVHQTIDISIHGTDGTSDIGAVAVLHKDKAASGGPTTHDLGSAITSTVDNQNHEIRAYSKNGSDIKLYSQASCASAYDGSLTDNITVFLKVNSITGKRVYIDFGSTGDPDWTSGDYILLHVKDSNGAFVTSIDNNGAGLLQSGQASIYLGYVTLPEGYSFQVYASANSGFTDHASQTPGYDQVISPATQDFLQIKSTCNIAGGYRDYQWCSLVDHSDLGVATIYKNNEVAATMAIANITNNYFIYENGLEAREGDELYVVVSGSTGSYTSISKTYDGQEYVGSIPWFLDDSIPLTISALDWQQVYVYAWKAGSDPLVKNAAFPGEAAAADGGNWSYNLDSRYDRIVISNGTDQTVDIEVNSRVHQYTVEDSKKENKYNCTSGTPTTQPLKVTADVRLNFYVTNTGKLSIAAVPFLGNGFYIMPSKNGNNEGFQNAVKMLTLSDTSASYASFNTSANSSYYIRSYMSAYDHLYTTYDLSAISTKATYNSTTGILTFGATGAGVYSITLNNGTVTVRESSDSENFRLNGLDVAPGSLSIKDQKTSLILEVLISATNAKNMNINAQLTNTFGGHVGALLYLNPTQLEDPWDYLRGSSIYPHLSSQATIANCNGTTTSISGHVGSANYYVYIMIDYLDKTMTSSDIGGEIHLTLNLVQA